MSVCNLALAGALLGGLVGWGLAVYHWTQANVLLARLTWLVTHFEQLGYRIQFEPAADCRRGRIPEEND